MKKQKMKLGDLKVQSFVTSMEKQQKQTIDGGVETAALCISLAVVTAIVASWNGCSATGQSIADVWGTTSDSLTYKPPYPNTPSANNAHGCLDPDMVCLVPQ